MDAGLACHLQRMFFSVRFRGQDWSGLDVRLLAPQPRRCRAICGVKLEHGCYWTREHWNKILKHDATASFFSI